MNSTNVERIITCPFIAFILTCSLSLEILIDAVIDMDDQGSIFIHPMWSRALFDSSRNEPNPASLQQFDSEAPRSRLLYSSRSLIIVSFNLDSQRNDTPNVVKSKSAATCAVESESSTASTFPLWVAIIRGVFPPSSLGSGSAPLASKKGKHVECDGGRGRLSTSRAVGISLALKNI